MKKRILIIGGMGPQASLTLHQKLIETAVRQGAESGADFPAITHVSIPVPEFIESRPKSAGALEVIKEHLYCLWRPRLHTRSNSL